MDKQLRIGIPKGSLTEATAELFRRAGMALHVSERGYFPRSDDSELSCVMFRAQEISRYVEDAVIDCGLTGRDWVIENDSDVREICELPYSKATSRPARWVLAVPAESKVQRPEDLDGGIVATELVNVVRRYFKDRDLTVKVEFSWGATEVKARLLDEATDGRGGIVELTETGSSLRANNLRIIDDVLSSTTRFIAGKSAWQDPWKRQKIEAVAMLLVGAIEAGRKVGLKMNAPRRRIDAVVDLLPAEKSPTISPLADEDFVAIEVIVERSAAPGLLVELKRAGASGIIAYPLNTVLH